MTQYTHQFNIAPWYERGFLYLVGALAFAPLVFLGPEIVTGNFEALNTSNADVLGTGTFLIFLAMLSITPLITMTGKRWFAPLRWWFGVMFFTTAAIDLTIAAIVTGADFKGGFLGRVAGHSFLLVGTTTTLLTLVLVATANKRSQRKLGKHWKTIQRLTYVVWALILLHLVLLFGVGGERFHQALFCSAPLAILRIPFVHRAWVKERERYGWHSVLLWLFGLIFVAVFMYGAYFLVSEEINKGVQAFSLNPVDD